MRGNDPPPSSELKVSSTGNPDVSNVQGFRSFSEHRGPVKIEELYSSTLPKTVRSVQHELLSVS